MVVIYSSENFIVESCDKPFVSRTDGGHVRIKVKDKTISDRTKLTSKQAIELMRLTIIVGDSLEKAMNMQGIPVVKINYQDMGNWAYKTGENPYLHIHIFGRAKNAKKQIFPEAVYLPARESGFYNSFEPLNDEDTKLIRKLMDLSFKTNRFSNLEWGLPNQKIL
jgi:diadenosine tetraphosphate (Ap4A) HIT family hydrolase